MSYLTHIDILHLWDFNTQYRRDKLVKFFSKLSSCLKLWLQQIPRQNRKKNWLFIDKPKTKLSSWDTFLEREGVPCIEVLLYLFFSILQGEIWDFWSNYDSGHYWERKGQLISPTIYPEKESEQKQRWTAY